MPTGPITQFHGTNAGNEWGLYPDPNAATPSSGREYQWLGDAGSNWKRMKVEGSDKVDHTALVDADLTRLSVGCEVDPGAVEVRISKNGVVAFTQTFTDQHEVATVALTVAAGDRLRGEVRSVSDPKAKEIVVVLG